MDVIHINSHKPLRSRQPEVQSQNANRVSQLALGSNMCAAPNDLRGKIVDMNSLVTANIYANFKREILILHLLKIHLFLSM